MSIRGLYEQIIKPLSAPERYELARLILAEIPPQAVVDYSDAWSEQDLREFTAHGMRRLSNDPDYEFDG